MNAAPPPDVVLLCADLMLTSSVSGICQSAGVTNLCTSDTAAVLTLLEAEHCPRLLIDFSLPGLDIADFAGRLPESVLKNAVAYGPHVHTAKIEAARRAGIGEVTSRGNFTARLQQYVLQTPSSS